MINILYTILLFNVLIIVFRLFSKYSVDNLQGLIINYMTAAICSYFFIKSEISFNLILNAKWIYHAILIGTLFIVAFYFFAYGIQKVGISFTTVTNKMSFIIPVTAALILYPKDTLTTIKGAAFILAIIGIFLSSTKGKKLSFNKKYLWIILLIFFSQGIADAIFSDFEQRYPQEDKYIFYMILFGMATISGMLILIIKSIRVSNKLQLKSLFWGVVFGIPNFFSLVFFIKALGEINNSVVFSLTSMGIVISSSLLGILIFKEKLSKRNWIGILISVISIFLFS